MDAIALRGVDEKAAVSKIEANVPLTHAYITHDVVIQLRLVLSRSARLPPRRTCRSRLTRPEDSLSKSNGIRQMELWLA